MTRKYLIHPDVRKKRDQLRGAIQRNSPDEAAQIVRELIEAKKQAEVEKAIEAVQAAGYKVAP